MLHAGNHRDKLILLFSLPLALLLAAVSLAGIFTPGFYASETLNWEIQSRGQDIMDLCLVVPVLLISGFAAADGNKTAATIWAGTLVYIVYTFIIYCFDVHFNSLFYCYCLTLGISFYALIYFFTSTARNISSTAVPASVRKTTAIYFMVISIAFYFLWLSEIIPAALHHTVPKTVSDAGLPTNAVHVLDIAIVLPAIFITGLLYYRSRPAGYLLTPILLTFFIMMDITITALTLMMRGIDHGEGKPVAVFTCLLAIVSLILLYMNLRKKTAHHHG